MSALDPPRVLLDSTFIAALTDHDEPFHSDAVAAYAALLDRYERDEVLLAATSDSLATISPAVRASLLAPVQTLIVAEQHRNASLEVYGASAEDPDFATLLVIIHREDVAVVASFDSRLDPFAIDVLPPRPSVALGDRAPAEH